MPSPRSRSDMAMMVEVAARCSHIRLRFERSNENEQSQLSTIQVAHGLQIFQTSTAERSQGQQHFTWRSALDAFLEARVAELVRFLRVANVLFRQVDLLQPAVDGVAGFLNAERELGAK